MPIANWIVVLVFGCGILTLPLLYLLYRSPRSSPWKEKQQRLIRLGQEKTDENVTVIQAQEQNRNPKPFKRRLAKFCSVNHDQLGCPADSFGFRMPLWWGVDDLMRVPTRSSAVIRATWDRIRCWVHGDQMSRE